MSDKPWAGVIGPEDERVYELAGFGGPSGFGERPALLVIDVQYRTLGDSPKPFEEAVKDYPTAGGEVPWASTLLAASKKAMVKRMVLPSGNCVSTNRSGNGRRQYGRAARTDHIQ